MKKFLRRSTDVRVDSSSFPTAAADPAAAHPAAAFPSTPILYSPLATPAVCLFPCPCCHIRGGNRGLCCCSSPSKDHLFCLCWRNRTTVLPGAAAAARGAATAAASGRNHGNTLPWAAVAAPAAARAAAPAAPRAAPPSFPHRESAGPQGHPLLLFRFVQPTKLFWPEDQAVVWAPIQPNLLPSSDPVDTSIRHKKLKL